MPHNDDALPCPTEPGWVLAERGDLGIDSHGYHLMRVLYLAYQLRVLCGVHNLGEPTTTGGPTTMNELPDLNILAARDARDGIVHRYVGAAVDHGHRILLLRRRQDASLNPGRWELATTAAEPGEHLTSTLDRALGDATHLGIDEILAYLGHHDFRAPDGARARQHTFVVTPEDLTGFRLGGNYADHRWELADGTTSAVEDSVAALLEQFQIAPAVERRQIEE